MRVQNPGVYVIRNIVTNKVYVGSSINTRSRLVGHRRQLRKGTHPNHHLQRAWNRYGADVFVFEVLEHCSVTDRLVREQFWINTLDACNEDRGYNLIPTRDDQLYGSAIAKYQRAGWAKLTEDERKQLNAHLNTPEMKQRVGKLSGLARSTPHHKTRQRAIAEKFLCTDANRKSNSDRLKARWQDPEFKAKRLEGLARGRAKTNASTDPDFLQKRAVNLAAGRAKLMAKVRTKSPSQEIV